MNNSKTIELKKEVSILKSTKKSDLLKYLILNFIGILVFFIPISIQGKSTIPLDHVASYVTSTFPVFVKCYALAFMVFGTVKSIFIDKSFRKSKKDFIFTTAKFAGTILGFMFIYNIGPKVLFEKDMLPFLFEKLVIPLSVVIPLGGAFIIFLIGYGMLEFMGVFMEFIMRPLFKTSGKSSLDAVASFVGSYSIGLLITNKVYKEGKYSLKESCIIATGFSTVSATFMIVVAKTLNLIEHWNFYFWSCIVITFAVTAITVRIHPLKNIPEDYYNDIKVEDESYQGNNLLDKAFTAGILSARKNKEPVFTQFFKSYKEGILITTGLISSIMSIGLLGLILAKYTPIFDLVGYIFYPFTLILGFEDPFLVAKALSTSIAEMFLPAIFVVNSDIVTRYVVAIVSVSEILFFSASIPCIMSTDIKIKISDLIIIWIERVILSLVLATLFGKLYF